MRMRIDGCAGPLQKGHPVDALDARAADGVAAVHEGN